MAEVAVREEGKPGRFVAFMRIRRVTDAWLSSWRWDLGVGDDEGPWSEATTLPESPSESVS